MKRMPFTLAYALNFVTKKIMADVRSTNDPVFIASVENVMFDIGRNLDEILGTKKYYTRLILGKHTARRKMLEYNYNLSDASDLGDLDETDQIITDLETAAAVGLTGGQPGIGPDCASVHGLNGIGRYYSDGRLIDDEAAISDRLNAISSGIKHNHQL